MENYKAIIRTESIGNNKSLLNKGLVPCILYGKGTEPKKIAFDHKTIKKIMQAGSFYSKILNLEVDGKTEKVLPKELQYHPVTDALIHIDFLRVQDNTKVTVEVPVEFLNQENCPGLKKGGVLNTVRRTIELICNANNIPEKLQYDLIISEIGDTVKISNIELPKDVKLTITDRDFVVATLIPPTIEVEEETKPEEEIEGEGEGEGEEIEGEEKTEDKEGKKEDSSETKEVKKEIEEEKK